MELLEATDVVEAELVAEEEAFVAVVALALVAEVELADVAVVVPLVVAAEVATPVVAVVEPLRVAPDVGPASW